jgi:AraC-like DNA-binding protein
MDNESLKHSFYFSKYRFGKRHTSHIEGVSGNYIVVMNSGNGRIVSGGRTIELKKDEILFIPDRCKYESFWSGDPYCEFETFVFKVYPESDVKPVLQKIVPTQEMLELYEKIRGISTVDCFSVGVVYQLLGLMLPVLQKRNESKHERLFNEAVSIISASDEINVPQIAEKLKISESTLYAVFKEVAGTSPVQMIHRIKVENAVSLLTTTDMTVQAISEASGFCTPQYFRKVLYKETGKTPKEIRNDVKRI